MSPPLSAVKASDTALQPVSSDQQPQANPLIGSAAQTALSGLSAPSAQPFAMVAANDLLRRSVGIPAFTEEQAEYVDALMRRHALAASEVPFVHMLHLAVFQHTHSLKERLNELANRHGTLASFSSKFLMSDPYNHASFAFFQLYNNGRRREALLEAGSQVFEKPYMGMKRQAELILKCYASIIKDLDGKAPKGVIRELQGELASLTHAWGATLAFADAAGQNPCGSIYLRAQLQPMKKQPREQQYISALQQLAKDGLQDMLGDYLAFVDPALPIRELGLHRTLDFSTMTKKKGFETIVNLQGMIFIQGAVLDEIEFVLDCLRKGSPGDIRDIQKILNCEDMTPEEIESAFEKAYALQNSVYMLNSAFGAVSGRIGSFDPSYPQKVEQTLSDLSRALGIQRRRPSDEQAVLAFLDRMPLPEPRLTPSPSPVQEAAPSPSPALPQDVVASPLLSSPAPEPRTPPRTPRFERGQREVERKEMPPSVASPPRVRAGMKLREVLQALRVKGITIVRQKGSHMQLSNKKTLALHPGDTLGPKAAKDLSEK